MDCTCPEAFRITFFFPSSPTLTSSGLAAFCLISGLQFSASVSAILRFPSGTPASPRFVPPFSCFVRDWPSRSSRPPTHCGYTLRLKSKRFYIVIVIIARRCSVLIQVGFICTCIYLLMAYFCLFMYSYAMSKIIVNMLIKFAPRPKKPCVSSQLH